MYIMSSHLYDVLRGTKARSPGITGSAFWLTSLHSTLEPYADVVDVKALTGTKSRIIKYKSFSVIAKC